MYAELFTIGRLSREAACNVQTIRYYEQIGLLPAPLRSSGNQRLYDESWTRRLRFIRHARDLGFELDNVRTLLDLADDPSKSCEAVDEVASGQLAQVEQRIHDLQALKRELRRMLKLCQGGTVADCRIIETLGNHDLCIADTHARVHASAKR